MARGDRGKSVSEGKSHHPKISTGNRQYGVPTDEQCHMVPLLHLVQSAQGSIRMRILLGSRKAKGQVTGSTVVRCPCSAWT